MSSVSCSASGPGGQEKPWPGSVCRTSRWWLSQDGHRFCRPLPPPSGPPTAGRQENRLLPPGLATFACRASAHVPGSSWSVSTVQHPGVFRCACPAPGPLGCGGSTPKPLAHSYTKPCVSPFGPSAHRVPDKNCDTQGWLCGEGGTRARQRLSSWQGPGSWCSPGQNFLAACTHTGSLFLTVGLCMVVLEPVLNSAVLEAGGVWLKDSWSLPRGT